MILVTIALAGRRGIQAESVHSVVREAQCVDREVDMGEHQRRLCKVKRCDSGKESDDKGRVSPRCGKGSTVSGQGSGHGRASGTYRLCKVKHCDSGKESDVWDQRGKELLGSCIQGQMLLAKALFDNVGETADELTFKRGDLLAVLEQDTDGLEGWWLCALQGQRGIVPGNRLRVLDKALQQRELLALLGRDKAVTPGDKTWHQPDKVVTPQRHGNTFVYDTPHKSGLSSPARSTDYDVPPSRSHSAASQWTALKADSDYDHPSSNRPVQRRVSPGGLDAPHQLQMQMLSLDHYDSCSNRSSTISMLSTGSNISGLSSSSGPHSSVCESERSSLDLSGHETYDVPPPARSVPAPAQRLNQRHGPPPLNQRHGPPPGTSVESSLYDTPKSHAKKVSHARSKSLDLLDDYDSLRPSSAMDMYDTPRKTLRDDYKSDRPVKPVSRNCSGDSGISLAIRGMQTYDVPSAAAQLYDVPTGPIFQDNPSAKRVEDNEYDTPKPSARLNKSHGNCDLDVVVPPSDILQPPGGGRTSPDGASSVYDVPPRVTKDCGNTDIDSGNTTKESEKRVSSGSSDAEATSCAFTEIRMELTAAMESLVNLQHTLNTACSKLLSFVHPAWRTQDSLEPKVYEVKLASVAVKKSGDQFLDFARGATANAAKSDDKKLSKRLTATVEVLCNDLDKFGVSLGLLNEEMWPLVKLVRQPGHSVYTEDELDCLVQIAKEIPEVVRSISGLIQGNSMLLFRRTGEPPITSTPKPKPKAPPPVKPKPRVSISSQEGSTPLAKFGPKSPDGTDTETPVRLQGNGKQSNTEDSTSTKTTPEQPSRLSFEQSDYDVPKPLAKTETIKTTADQNIPEPDNLEYDYVSLTKDPKFAQELKGLQEKETEPIKKEKEQDSRVEMREKETETERVSGESMTGRSRVVQSLFPPPNVRTSGLSISFKERMEKLQKEAEEPVKVHTEDYDIPQSRASVPNPKPVDRARSQNIQTSQLRANDRMILKFYASQVNTHSTILVNAIEAFIRCINEKQPPKEFIAYSKFVILAAHKMVYIGDTLTRHLVNDNIRNDIMNHAYTLCELLKVTVTTTKKAALDFPNVQSCQDMVDRVSEVSLAAHSLKSIILRFDS